MISHGRSEQPLSPEVIGGQRTEGGRHKYPALDCPAALMPHLWSQQEEGVMLMQLRDYSDEVNGPGFVPIPAKEAKRARTKLLPGSCLIIQPMPSNPGARTAQASQPIACVVRARLFQAVRVDHYRGHESH